MDIHLQNQRSLSLRLVSLPLLLLVIASCAQQQERKDATNAPAAPSPAALVEQAPPSDTQAQAAAPSPTAPQKNSDAPSDEVNKNALKGKLENSVSVTEVVFSPDIMSDAQTVLGGMAFPAGELKGVSSQVRGTLLADGITVLMSPSLPPPSDDANEYFIDILSEIEKNKFGRAHYVLFGVASLINVDQIDEPVPGTDVNMRSYDLIINVAYSMIDTTNREVVASFTAVGHGKDIRLAAQTDKMYKPNFSAMIIDAERDLAADVENNLQVQGIVVPPAQEDEPAATARPSLPQKPLGPDLDTLKIYH